MEKIFIHSTLFSTAILVVYALASPPQSLSAESSVQLDPNTKVRKGTIAEINQTANMLDVKFEDILVPVYMNASTTFHSPDGEEGEISLLHGGSSVYVFGKYDTETRSIEAEKIVLRKRSPMERKTLSRAEMNNVRKLEQSSSSSIVEELSLTSK